MKSFGITWTSLFSVFISVCLSAVDCFKFNQDIRALRQHLNEEYGRSVKAHPHHLGPPMGVSNRSCDDGKHGIETDWNPLSEYEYTCYPTDNIQTTAPSVRIDKPEVNGPVYHICLDKKIIYDQPIPLSGNHRPLWPKYGEYLYLPPQRWVHSIEHGAVALLYHPCMRESQDLNDLKQIVRGCLKKHIITPYRNLPDTHPLAVITYRHGLLLSHFAETDMLQYVEVIDFIKTYAQKAPERKENRDGQYSVGLLYGAEVVSDYKDSNICPLFPS